MRTMIKRLALLTGFFAFNTVAHAVLSVGAFLMSPSYCGRPTGQVSAYGQGGTPPYTYSWSTGGTEATMAGLVAGTYTVTVTDAVLDQAVLDVDVPLESSYTFYTAYNFYPLGYLSGDPYPLALYTGQDNYTDPYDPTDIHGPPPYSFSHPNLIEYTQASTCQGNTPVYNLLEFSGAPGTQYNVDFWDADGCPGTLQVVVGDPLTWPNMQIVGIGPSCQNGASGTMTVAVSGSDYQRFGMYVRRANEAFACPANEAQGFAWTGDTFGDGVRTFNGLQPGDHYLIWTNDGFNLYAGNALFNYEHKDSLLFTVPLIAADCGNLSGRLYLDDDGDCAMDGGENRVPNSIVTVEPGPYYLTTNNTGQYNAALPYGSYTVNEQHPVFVQSCAAAVTLSTPVTQVVNIGCVGNQPMDATVNASSGPARPGFALSYGMHVHNQGPGSTGNVTLTMEFDPVLTFVSGNPAPAVNGNVLTWTTPDIALTTPFGYDHATANFTVPPDVGLIGTDLLATFNVTTQNADGDLSNNTYAHSVTVTGSFDPNDKTARTSSDLSRTEYYLQQDEWIDYTIRFQNTGTDTAFNIVVTDTLPLRLDPATIQMGAASHPYTWQLTLEGTLRVVFADVLLPDSNVNEAASHGFVLFRVRPHAGLLPGQTITNIANIYFDFNEPVITEPSVLVAEFSTGITDDPATDLVLAPVPASDQLRISSGTIIDMITILTADGRSIAQQRVRSTTTTLVVSAFPSGTYFLITNNADGSMHRTPFTVVHY